MDVAYTPALAMAASIRRGDYTSAEATEAILRRIDDVNPRINAYLTVAGDQAMDAARDADRRRAEGADDAPFLGVPISIKDLSNTAGIRTTFGTRTWAERVPDTDDEIVRRIRAAGFVILGKTNTPEFGQSVVSEPPGYPPARNPWDPTLTPGGSSGGAAAAVAAGLGPVAQGSDTGGSVRIPAALCGVVGLRPSRGRISPAPVGVSLQTTHGPLARTVADCAALLDVMAGPTVGDEFSAPPPPRPFLDEVVPPARSLRIAFSSEPFMLDIEASEAHRSAPVSTAKQLEALGHNVVETSPPWDPSIVEASLGIFAAELAAGAHEKPPVHELDAPAQMLIGMGGEISAVDYVRAKERVRMHAIGVHRFFQEWDVLITPTVPIPPLPVGAFVASDEPPSVETLMQFRALTAFTALCTFTGVPGLSLPLAVDEAGLPVGLQFMARMNDEATLLALGCQLEQALPWADRRPPIA